MPAFRTTSQNPAPQKIPHRAPPRVVIGVMGVKGSGKDTAAKFLIDELDYKRVAFADALYQEAADAFGVSVEFLGKRDTKEIDLPELALANCKDTFFVQCMAVTQGTPRGNITPEFLAAPRSPRLILQLWGTEYRRRGVPGVCVGKDSYWLDRVAAAIAVSPETSFVITDVRFLNEMRFVSDLGGSVVRVRRQELEAREAHERAVNGCAAHASETELLKVAVDRELFNVEGKPGHLRFGVLAYAHEMARAAKKQAVASV